MSGPRSIESIIRFIQDNGLKPGDRVGNDVWDGTTWHTVEPDDRSLEQKLRGVVALRRNHWSQRIVDPVARFAQAWDGIGRNVYCPPFEHMALLARAGLDIKLHGTSWRSLSEYQRQALLRAARQSVQLGRHSAWVFGEGEGA